VDFAALLTYIGRVATKIVRSVAASVVCPIKLAKTGGRSAKAVKSTMHDVPVTQRTTVPIWLPPTVSVNVSSSVA
jgi:hypothetical protein